MGVSSSESHDLTAFYEMLMASFGVLSQNTGFYPSLDRIVETMLRPLNLGPGGRSYNEPISHLHRQPHAHIHHPFFITWVGLKGAINNFIKATRLYVWMDRNKVGVLSKGSVEVVILSHLMSEGFWVWENAVRCPGAGSI